MSDLLFDLRDIVRGLRRDRLYAATASTLVASLVFEGHARDPVVIAGVAVLVGAVGLTACATAARQGLRIDPAAALRDE
jgi:hypothetical protein